MGGRLEASERLRRALTVRGWTPYGLHRALRGRGVKGASYTNLRLVIEGGREPTNALLDAAADVLQVRPEWLVLGRGAMTEELEAVAGEPAENVGGLAELIKAVPEMRYADPYVHMALVRAASEWVEVLVPNCPAEDRPTALLAAAEGLWNAVTFPGIILRAPGSAGETEEDARERYARARELFAKAHRQDGWVGYAPLVLQALIAAARVEYDVPHLHPWAS